LLGFLNKKLFKPMLAYLDKRAETIRNTLEDANNAKTSAEADREQARHDLDEARRESYAIRTQAREIAGSERARIIDDARAESEQIIDKTQREIAQSIERARESLREQTAALAIDVAEKVLRGELTDEQKRKATTVYLDEAANV
jgi:F-type H+-transporting ATPase subunit b